MGIKNKNPEKSGFFILKKCIFFLIYNKKNYNYETYKNI